MPENGSSTRSNVLGMRPMQERGHEKRGEQYLLIKSPPASGKSRALMFIALDKLQNQGLRQAIIVVPERSIGASFHDEPLTQFGFWADWSVARNGISAMRPAPDNGGKVKLSQTVSRRATTRYLSLALTPPSGLLQTGSGLRRSTTA